MALSPRALPGALRALAWPAGSYTVSSGRCGAEGTADRRARDEGGQLVSTADCSIAPFLERYSRNGAIANGGIPQLADLAARARGRAWPHIARWYGAMDGWAPYASRIEGDAYSYAKLADTSARFDLRLRAGAPARDGAQGAGGEGGGGRARRALRAPRTAAHVSYTHLTLPTKRIV